MSDFKIKEAPVVNEQAQPILTHEKSLSQKIARGSEAGDILDQDDHAGHSIGHTTECPHQDLSHLRPHQRGTG